MAGHPEWCWRRGVGPRIITQRRPVYQIRRCEVRGMLPGAEQRRGSRRGGGLRRAATATAAFALYSLRRFNADGCFAAAGALSYTALVSLVPLAAIALGSLSVFPIFGQLHDQILGLVFKYLHSLDRRAGGVVVPRLRQFRGADDGDRGDRHRRYRGPAAGHGRGPAQPDLAGDGTTPVGAARSRLLDADHPRPAFGRPQPVAVDLFRARRAPRRFQPGSLSVAGERLAARDCARRAGGARIRRADLALLADPEWRGSRA